MSAKGMSPMTSLIQSSIWTLIGVVFFSQSWNKISHLQSAGQYVTHWQYAQTVFWVCVILFWIWNVWRGWQRYHADKG
jgi:hypothetical protein